MFKLVLKHTAKVNFIVCTYWYLERTESLAEEIVISSQFQFQILLSKDVTNKNDGVQLTCTMDNNKRAGVQRWLIFKAINGTWNIFFSRSFAPIHPKNFPRSRLHNHWLPQLCRNLLEISFIYRLQFILASDRRTTYIWNSLRYNLNSIPRSSKTPSQVPVVKVIYSPTTGYRTHWICEVLYKPKFKRSLFYSNYIENTEFLIEVGNYKATHQ